jgi:competence protein ComEA
MRHRAAGDPADPASLESAAPQPGESVSESDESGGAPEEPELFTGPRTRSARVRVGLGAAIVLSIGALVVAVVVSASAQQGRSATITSGAHPLSATDAPGSTDAPVTVDTNAPGALVHVLGAVRRPGLVQLAAGARVVDAVASAGGLTEDADAGGVNLARVVADGEQLYVPHLGETPPAPPAQTGAGGQGAASGSGAGAVGAKVALNTATQAELETLPRIGPALAQRILDWRSANGRFSAVDDLMKVVGIGQKLFGDIKDRVTV